MSGFSVDDVLSMQRQLQEKYSGQWEPISPEKGKNMLLWMVGEIGEVADVIKKNGEEKALTDPELRHHLVEEMADVLMYYGDVMLCYGITAEELESVYREKFHTNMERW